MKLVRIQYTIREGVDLSTVKAEISRFVAGIAAHSAEHRYTSYQSVEAPRQFVHLGAFGDQLEDLQAQPFFGAFAAFLRERCESGPAVTPLEVVASTQ